MPTVLHDPRFSEDQPAELFLLMADHLAHVRRDDRRLNASADGTEGAAQINSDNPSQQMKIDQAQLSRAANFADVLSAQAGRFRLAGRSVPYRRRKTEQSLTYGELLCHSQTIGSVLAAM
jgi:hypothetical protein